MMTVRASLFRNAVSWLTLAAALTACADLRWYKAGADAAALEPDLEQCRQEARLQAAREAWPFGLTSPRMMNDE